jgi:hypothetical protein
MAIDLSTLTFTNLADIVPTSGTDQIINTGTANTLGGDDRITGISSRVPGIFNEGTINTGFGNDAITGIGSGIGIFNVSTINTGAGNDTITTGTGISSNGGTGFGIYNYFSTINTGAGNDTITGLSSDGGAGIYNNVSTINTDDGDDAIKGTGGGTGIYNNVSTINTGAGNDTITGTAFIYFGTGISNRNLINTGDDNDTIINTGDGDDTITGTSTNNGQGIFNYNSTINTGFGNDTITGTSTNGQGIANFGIINTGFGNDTITGTGSLIGSNAIVNYDTINTGDGNDIVNALTGSFGGTGTTLLENGSDVVKGFGSGRFNGGNGYDKLQLTTIGTYTVSRSGSTVSFSKAGVPGVVMNTTLFEQLIAGNATYSFSNLTNGQVIADRPFL